MASLHLAVQKPGAVPVPVPLSVRFGLAIERIPTSAVGKILRRELTKGDFTVLAEVCP